MNFFLALLLIIFLTPPIIVITFLFWLTVGNIIESILDLLFPPPAPYCHIDPRCDERFIWDENGDGRIEGIKVL